MKKRIIIVSTLLILAAIGAGGYLGYIYSNVKNWTNFIYPGVKIEGQDVSGMKPEEAKALLQKKFGDNILKKSITIKTPNKNYSLDFSKLNAKYNIDDVVKQAFSYGKELKMLDKYKLIRHPVNKAYALKFNYDQKPIKDLIATIEKNVNKNPVDGSLTFENGKFNVTPDVKGAKLIKDKLQSEVLSKVNGDVASPNIVVEAEVKQLNAKKTKEMLDKINTKISSFSTDFSTSNFERSTNITLATQSINGTLLMPGDTFSFNGIVGERTPQKGYQQAPEIVGNTTRPAYGGGICQVSTTLYNAVLMSNIKATERYPHNFPSHYVDKGRDATVDYGNLDYKFKNTLSFPIYIEGYIKNKNVYFNIYSDTSLTKRTYQISTDVYQTIPAEVKYTNDPTLPVGQTVVDQYPSTGYRVKVYKDAYENGNIVEHELVSNDLYKAVDQLIRRGTKTK